MDPMANIEEQRKLAAFLLASTTDIHSGAAADAAFRLAELVEALDEWQRSGGFSPYGPTTLG